MKKIFTILSIAAVSLVSAQAFTATYAFEGTPPAVNGVLAGDGAANLTSSNFTTTYEQTATGSRFANTGAPTANAVDASKYLQVVVTPVAGNVLSISSISFRSQRSGTGPRSYVVRSSVDNFATNLPASISPANAELEVLAGDVFHWVNDGVTMGQNGNLVTISNATNLTSAVTYRFYFFEAEAAAGTFSVDDVVISGEAVPYLAVGDANAKKVSLVKNTVVANDIIFGAAAKVNVYNMAGQIVKSAEVKDGSTLNVSSLAKGTYVVSGIVNGEAVSTKIIKK